jgi:hypothetical protein
MECLETRFVELTDNQLDPWGIAVNWNTWSIRNVLPDKQGKIANLLKIETFYRALIHLNREHLVFLICMNNFERSLNFL